MKKRRIESSDIRFEEQKDDLGGITIRATLTINAELTIAPESADSPWAKEEAKATLTRAIMQIVYGDILEPANQAEANFYNREPIMPDHPTAQMLRLIRQLGEERSITGEEERDK